MRRQERARARVPVKRRGGGAARRSTTRKMRAVRRRFRHKIFAAPLAADVIVKRHCYDCRCHIADSRRDKACCYYDERHTLLARHC